MATASSAQSAVGTVKVVIGDVKVIGVDGVVRAVVVGDKVYAREIIETAANAVVQVELANGRLIDLGRNSQIALDDSVLDAGYSAVAAGTATGASVEEIQALIAAGADPAQVAEATAAGGTPDGVANNEGGHEPLVIDQVNSAGPVTAGYQTNPIAFAPTQVIDPNLPPLPRVSVRVEPAIPNEPPPAPPGTPPDVPFARTDVDFIPRTSAGALAMPAIGNVISGVGTTSGIAGADTPGSEGAAITAVSNSSGTPATVGAGGALTVTGQYGTLVLQPDGSYVYTLNNPASPPAGVADTFTYTLTDGSGDTSTANLIIDIGSTDPIPGDEPGGDGMVVTVSGASLIEGTHPDAKEVIFVVQLDRASATPVEVTYEIRPGSASTPDDFTGVLTGTVIIPANTTSVEVPVNIVQDHLVEANENFTIVLLNAVNAVLDEEASTATVTIIDDDLPPDAQDDSFSITRGQSNDLPSVLTRLDGLERVDDSGAGPFETLSVVQGPNDTALPGGDIGITTAQGGTVVMHPDGTFTYTPPASLQGPDSFVYTMTDGFNGTDSATVTLNPSNEPPTVKINLTPAEAQVNEAGLAVIGSDPNSPSEKVQGTFTIADPDGVDDIIQVTINDQVFTPGELPGKTIPTFIDNDPTKPLGLMTIDGFDPVTGVVSFTYELLVPVKDLPNQPEQDLFKVTVTDNTETSSAPVTLAIDIIDDLPVARDDTDSVAPGTFGPETGNVITGAGTTDPVSGKDTLGADSATLTGVASPAGNPTVNPDGSFTIAGLYGVLTISPNGDYTYTRNPATPGGVTDTFTYTLTDGDGDPATANLAIEIGDSSVQLGLPGTKVSESGLPARGGEPAGSDEPANSETTAGAITFTAIDGLASVTLNGTPVTGAGQLIPGAHGTLEVTGFTHDPVTGNGVITYSYVLTDNTVGDTTSDDFTVVVTETDGDQSTGKLTIDVVDDVPAAHDDSDSVAAGSLLPATGNVITGVGTNEGAGGAGTDTPGADDVTLTAIGSTNVPGSVATVNADGSLTIPGQYGTLTIFPDGEYSYARTPGSPGGVVDIFRYTLTDNDGDATAANLAIDIGDALVELKIEPEQVKEAALPTGSTPLSDEETTTGVITFTAKDGLQSVTLDGVTVTGAGQTIPGDHGTLTVTGYTHDPVTGLGTVTYSYTLTQATQGDTTKDEFPVVITELDGSIASTVLTITIIDDVPSARNDADSVALGDTGTTGNVITGVGTDTGGTGADTKGADDATLTAIASTNVPGNAPTSNPDGSQTIAGQYGVLTIFPNGEYTYARDAGSPGGVVDTFRYILTDGDRDASAANLSITIGDAGGVLAVAAAEVKEEGLPARGLEPEGSKANDDSETALGAFTFKTVDGLGSVTLDGVAVTGPGQDIAGDHGTLTVTGLTYDPVTGDGAVTYTYTLTDNTAGDTTTDEFTVVVTDLDGDSSTGTLLVNIIDDVPSITARAAAPNLLQVDESNLNLDDTADLSTLFTSVPGADDATIAYTLDVKSPGVNSGLTDVASGQPVYLFENAGGVIEGRVGDPVTGLADPAGAVAFELSLDPMTGIITLNQILALQHPNAADADDAVSLGAADLITITGSITDGDGDVATAVVNLGDAISFKDDGPTITVNNNAVPVLTVDETDLATNAAASFANNFSNSFGADGAGSVGYALSVGAAPSGLKDVATGADIVLVNNAGVIEGHAGVGGPIAFTVSVNAAGVLTLDQLRALTHPDATNADDPVSLAAGSLTLTATSTDKDGDSASAALNIGGALSFKDDGPTIVAGVVAGAVEEEALPVVGNQDTNDIPNTGLVATGSLTGLASFGADGAGSFSLDGSAIASLTAQGLKSDGVALTYSINGDTLTAKAGALDVFTLQVTSGGAYTFTLKDQLDHAVVQGENTLDINFGSLLKVVDRDGDSVSLGGATGADFKITVQDDIPVAKSGASIVGAVDEDGLPGANIDAGRAGEVAGTGSATVSGAAGALNALVSVGADQPGTFGFGSDLSSLTVQNLISNGVVLSYSVTGNTLTAKAGALDVFTLQITSAGGYTFTLKDQLDHPTLNGLAGDNTENTMAINFGGVVKVTDRDGDTLTLGSSSFKITVQDDIPVAANITKSTAADVGAVTNLTLILDVSGSMANIVTVNGQSMTRLDAEKLSAKALIDEYAALGPVKVSLVTFSAGSDALGYWLDANAAKAAIDGIGGPGGTTNYTAGLDKAKLAYDGTAAHNGLLSNAQDVLYFLSDGVPNPTSTGLDTAAEVTAWENFLKGAAGSGNVLGEKITAFALGMGPDVAAAQLNPIAYNGVNATNTNAIIVSDFSQLTQTLISTVQIQEVMGNLLTDPTPDAGFGADAPGWVQVLNVDGKTYVYDLTTDSTTGSTGTNGTFDTVTNQWTITTANGGKIVVDMDDGAYVYTPAANFAGSKVENVGFTLTDRDGDTASANLRINVEGPSLVVGQNVNDQPGQTTPHKVDPLAGNTGLIGGSGSNDILIGDVGGGSLQGKATNVILILDTSGSMATEFGKNQPTRLQGMKDGVNDMIDSLKSSGATDVRVHINHFSNTVASGAAGAQTFNLVINGVVQATQVANAHLFVNSFTAGGFTNYEAGLQEAISWVDGPNELIGSNVVNQAIFVSDGQPNRALDGNSTNLNNVVNYSDNVSGWNQAINQVLGAGGSDSVNEVVRLETSFGQIQAIGMGLDADALARLTLVEGAGGAATNTTNAAEFKDELANVNPVSALGAVGDDILNGGSGNDIIFGDAVNTDALAAAKGLNLPAGSGWAVFETLEAGAGWTRDDTQNYIRTHQDELAAESTGTGGAKRAGGNDTIDAGAGNDRVYGQEGNDIIIGGAGNDILNGGSGADTFKWNNGDQGTAASPALDTISDFNPTATAANKDVLDLHDLLQGEDKTGDLSAYLSFSQTGANVTLSVHSAGASGPVDQTIVLQGVTMAQLAGSNPADSAGVIANLLDNNKLITD